jgi:hypothetical protein
MDADSPPGIRSSGGIAAGVLMALIAVWAAWRSLRAAQHLSDGEVFGVIAICLPAAVTCACLFAALRSDTPGGRALSLLLAFIALSATLFFGAIVPNVQL